MLRGYITGLRRARSETRRPAIYDESAVSPRDTAFVEPTQIAHTAGARHLDHQSSFVVQYSPIRMSMAPPRRASTPGAFVIQSSSSAAFPSVGQPTKANVALTAATHVAPSTTPEASPQTQRRVITLRATARGAAQTSGSSAGAKVPPIELRRAALDMLMLDANIEAGATVVTPANAEWKAIMSDFEAGRQSILEAARQAAARAETRPVAVRASDSLTPRQMFRRSPSVRSGTPITAAVKTTTVMAEVDQAVTRQSLQSEEASAWAMMMKQFNAAT